VAENVHPIKLHGALFEEAFAARKSNRFFRETKHARPAAKSLVSARFYDEGPGSFESAVVVKITLVRMELT
jgi:hypothetical protein